MISRSELKRLQSHRDYPSVSLLAPTNRTAPANKKDPIVVKNLLTKGLERLYSEFSKREIAALVKNLNTLVNRVDWEHALDGLALFASKDSMSAIYLPFRVKPRFVIDATFATRDLVFALNRAPRYRVLVLSEKFIRFPPRGPPPSLSRRRISLSPWSTRARAGRRGFPVVRASIDPLCGTSRIVSSSERLTTRWSRSRRKIHFRLSVGVDRYPRVLSDKRHVAAGRYRWDCSRAFHDLRRIRVLSANSSGRSLRSRGLTMSLDKGPRTPSRGCGRPIVTLQGSIRSGAPRLKAAARSCWSRPTLNMLPISRRRAIAFCLTPAREPRLSMTPSTS